MKGGKQRKEKRKVKGENARTKELDDSFPLRAHELTNLIMKFYPAMF